MSSASCRQFGILSLPVPRQQFAEPVDRMPLGHEVNHSGEVGLGSRPLSLALSSTV
jgi:hypothetical protein